MRQQLNPQTQRSKPQTGNIQKPSGQNKGTNPASYRNGVNEWISPAGITAVLTAGLLVVYGIIALIMWHTMLVDERPHILVGNITMDESKWPDQANRSIEFDIQNFGKSPAWLERYVVRARVAASLNLTGPPNYGPSEETFGVVPPQQGGIHTEYSGTLQTTEAEEEAYSNEQPLFLFGFVSYRDQHMLGNGMIARLRNRHLHRAGFAFRYDRNNKRFVICGDRSYWSYT